MADWNFLLERGYRKIRPSSLDGDCVTDIFQKRFDDEKGKRYFITARRWDMSQFNNATHTYPISYEYDTQLYKKDTHDALNLEFHSSWKIEDVEKFLKELFETGKFDYYETWNQQ